VSSWFRQAGSGSGARSATHQQNQRRCLDQGKDSDRARTLVPKQHFPQSLRKVFCRAKACGCVVSSAAVLTWVYRRPRAGKAGKNSGLLEAKAGLGVFPGVTGGQSNTRAGRSTRRAGKTNWVLMMSGPWELSLAGVECTTGSRVRATHRLSSSNRVFLCWCQ